MKKRMIAFFAMLLMMLSCIPVGGLTIADAAEDLIMKLHYHRPDNSWRRKSTRPKAIKSPVTARNTMW